MSIADKLTAIADNVQNVYNAGYNAQYDEFWDSYQNKGERTNYREAFAGEGWNDVTFKPKHPLAVTDAMNMFYISKITNIRDIDIDLSDCTRTTQMFSNSYIEYIGNLDISKATTTDNMFAYMYTRLKEIGELKVSEQTSFKNPFANTTGLTKLIVAGTIGQNGFSVGPCTKLDKESVQSIINALSPETSALTVSLSKAAVDKAFETATDAADGSTSEEWANLIATKPNWTISLL